MNLTKFAVWIVGALWATGAMTANLGLGEEPLPPDQAFRFSAEAAGPDTLVGEWEVAEGYYLYHDKISFESKTDGITLGDPRIPPGKKKTDEFFGEVETHRNRLRIEVPMERAADAPDEIELVAKSQGCADMGICYPPYSTTVTVALAAADASSADKDPVRALSQLGNSLGLQDASQEFLEPDQAFKLTGDSGDGAAILRWDIAPGYYLYKDKFKFSLKGDSGARLGEPVLPEGKIKEDEFFGRMEVFYDQVEARVPIEQAKSGQSLELAVSYQGCADAGLCYPPQTKPVNLTLSGTGMQAAAQANAEQQSPLDPGATPMTPPDGEQLSAKTVLLTLLGAFGVGLLLTFTPCVLPMIPILSSIIVGQSGGSQVANRGGLLSIAYVLGTAVTWTAAGILAGATGDQLQAYFQNPWAIGIFAVILVTLALSMFGFYEIQMPSAIQSKLQTKSQDLKGGSVAGVFVMGLISALIVGACVSPLLISVLGLAIALGDPVLGGATMFAMAMGMGVILIAIGFGAGFIMPKAGSWMDRVKYVFGVMLLAVAIYLLSILPGFPALYFWAALLIITGVYMGATQSLPAGAGGWHYLWKGLGTFLLIWGIAALLGAFQGNRDILRPLPWSATVAMTAPSGGDGGAASGQSASDHGAMFTQVRTLEELDARFAEAQAAGKPVLLDYFATWCTDCLRMEKGTFTDATVKRLMEEEFVALQVDVTDPNDEQGRAIKKRFGVFGPPALLFFDDQGNALKSLNFYGYKPADEFADHLRTALERNS